MKLLKSDIANLDESNCISWQYQHLERYFEDGGKFSNSFDALITFNIKDNWLVVHLLRYGIGNNPQIVQVDKIWFIPDANNIEGYFYPSILEQTIYKKLKKSLKEKYVNLCDFSDAANQLKNSIDEQKNKWTNFKLNLNNQFNKTKPKKSKRIKINFDRFTDYHDAVDAWHKEERCCGKRMDGGKCENDPLAVGLIPLCFGKWLYSKVEKDN